MAADAPDRAPMKGEQMQVWLLSGRDDWRAVTLDRSGSQLPRERGPWQLLCAVHLDEDDADDSEAATAVRIHGYFMMRARPLDRPTH